MYVYVCEFHTVTVHCHKTSTFRFCMLTNQSFAYACAYGGIRVRAYLFMCMLMTVVCQCEKLTYSYIEWS